jgi:hypothetical protein
MVGINSMIARKAADGLMITDVNYSIMSNVAIQWLAGLGYNVPVNREVPSESGGEVTKVPETVEKKSDQPKTGEDIQPYKEEPVKEKDKPKEDVANAPKEIPTQPSGDKPRKEKDKPKKSEGGKILTKKKPYKTNRLLRDIQAMEDMMDEMREKINKYKEKKY